MKLLLTTIASIVSLTCIAQKDTILPMEFNSSAILNYSSENIDSIKLNNIHCDHIEAILWANDTLPIFASFDPNIAESYMFKGSIIKLRLSHSPVGVYARLTITKYKNGSQVGLNVYGIPNLKVYYSNNKIVLENSGNPRELKLDIYSLDGRLIQTSNVYSEIGRDEIALFIDQGVYILYIKDKNKTMVKKIQL